MSRRLTKEHKRKIALAHLGLKLSVEAKRKKSEYMKKMWSNLDYKQKMSEAHKGNEGFWTGKSRKTPWMEGENNPQWQGGIYKFNYADRQGAPYRKWRNAVLKRDKKCVACGSTERLEADHIKPFSTYKELRFEVSNGRTLCKPCHHLLGAKLLGRNNKYLVQ